MVGIIILNLVGCYKVYFCCERGCEGNLGSVILDRVTIRVDVALLELPTLSQGVET